MAGQWKNPGEEGGGGEASSPQLIKKNVRLRESGLYFQQSGEFKSKILPIKSIDVTAKTHSLGVMGYRCIKLPVVNIIQEHNVNHPQKYNKMYCIYLAISLSWLSAETLNSQNQYNQEKKINPKHLAISRELFVIRL